MKQRWQDWSNLVLGLWVFFSPWILQQALASGTAASSAATWNLYIVGIAVAVVAAGALFAFQVWEEWTNVVLGAWLFASPWVLGFSSSAVLMWNAVVVGALIVILAGWAMVPSQNSVQGPKKHA